MGKTYNKFGLIMCGALSALLIGAPAGAQTTTFTATYKANSSGTSCTATDNINGVEPSASGKYPVFLYMVGIYNRCDCISRGELHRFIYFGSATI